MTAVDTWAVQESLFTLLDGDVSLAALLNGGVTDDRKQDIAFPYVSLGPDVLTDDATVDSDGIQVVTTLDIWSRFNGFKEVKQIRHAIRNLVDRQNLSVAGLSSCIMFDDGGNDLVDRDVESYHGVMRIRMHCRE